MSKSLMDEYRNEQELSINGWSYLLSQIYPDSVCMELFRKLKALSSVEFADFESDVLSNSTEDDVVAFFNHVYETQQKEDYDIKKMGCTDIPVHAFSCDVYSGCVNVFQSLADYGAMKRIELTMPVFQKMFDLWHVDGDVRYLHHIPSDLLFSGKIGITDLEICIKDLFPEDVGFDPVIRVQLLDSFGSAYKGLDDILSLLKEDDILVIGKLVFPLNKEDTKGVAVGIGIQEGLDVVLLSNEVYCYGMDKSDPSWKGDGVIIPGTDFFDVCATFLQIWYTIQVFLSDPRLSEIFSITVKNKDRRKRLCGISCQKIARMLPICTVTDERLAEVLNKYKFKKNVNLNYLPGGWERIDGISHFVPGWWYTCDGTEPSARSYPNWPYSWKEMRSIFGEKLLAFQKEYDVSDKSSVVLTSDEFSSALNMLV